MPAADPADPAQSHKSLTSFVPCSYAFILQVPLFKVTMDGLAGILDGYRGRYSAVVGFSPTGWNHNPARHAPAADTAAPAAAGGGRGRGRGAGRGGRGGGGGGLLSREQQSAPIGRRSARGSVVLYQASAP
jgi:hypothetical protein